MINLNKPLIRFVCALFYSFVVLLFSTNAFASQSQSHYIPIGSDVPNHAPVKGIGSVEKNISVERAGWYELFIHAAPWPTDLFLDGELLGHFSLSDKVWKSKTKNKVLNLFLQAGVHKLRIERLYHPGLPYIHSVRIEPADNLSGKISITPKIDGMVHRSGDDFIMHLKAEKTSSSYNVNFAIRDAFTDEVVNTLTQVIPFGSGIFNADIHLPTNKEGVFNVEAKHLYYGQVARPFQYVVIDTSPITSTPTNTKQELIARIVPVQTKPDYSSPGLSLNTQDITTLGTYLETSGNGVYGKKESPDYFAYELNLPDSSGFYRVEIDYPDNMPRTFTISLVENSVSPYALDSGVVTGGKYPLSQKIQTSQIYFHAREHNPRLLFLNWHQDKKIAVSEIRIYRVDENSLEPLIVSTQSERKFSAFYEEPMRFTSYFGAKPIGNDWTEIYTTAKRWAKWSNFVGQNQWLQSIANYQHTMWPTDLLPGYAPADEDGFSLLGPVSPYDFQKKDIVQLLLLMAEKYGVSFIGELFLPASGHIKEALDKRFNGTNVQSNDHLDKPWLIVSDDGKTGGQTAFRPYFNPVHPEVQAWVESIVKELALRYKDSPAFDGLAIRLMGWAFSSWQAFPSIHWGYGDFTIKKFEAETGIKIPVSMTKADRFSKRYEWLLKNHYDDWVNWRVSSITNFHRKLYAILKTARPDLKLYINAFGPDFSQSDWGKYGGWQGRYHKMEKLGWSKMLRETGVDPLMYKNDSGIIFSNSFKYPAGVKAQFKAKGKVAKRYADLQQQEANNSDSIKLSNKDKDGGTTAAVRFTNEYMEYAFPVKWIGYDSLQWRNEKKLSLAASIQPSGRSALQRYAWAMSEGNINFMSDGGLGYVLGDPLLLRSFMREYHSLPDIGMRKLSGSSNSALWYGQKGSEYYMYLINNNDKNDATSVCFSAKSQITRITTGEKFSTDTGNKISLSLKPYELVVYMADSVPISLAPCQ